MKKIIQAFSYLLPFFLPTLLLAMGEHLEPSIAARSSVQAGPSEFNARVIDSPTSAASLPSIPFSSFNGEGKFVINKISKRDVNHPIREENLGFFSLAKIKTNGNIEAGFFWGDFRNNSNNPIVYLVTNKHVAGLTYQDYKGRMHVQSSDLIPLHLILYITSLEQQDIPYTIAADGNTEGEIEGSNPFFSGIAEITVSNPAWISHPSLSVDLCVLPINSLISLLNQELRLRKLEIVFRLLNSRRFQEGAVEMDSILEPDLSEELFIFGYPPNYGQYHDLPLCIKGSFSTLPSIDFDDRPEFLADVRGVTLTSGSPVLLKTANKFHLLGIFCPFKNYLLKTKTPEEESLLANEMSPATSLLDQYLKEAAELVEQARYMKKLMKRRSQPGRVLKVSQLKELIELIFRQMEDRITSLHASVEQR